MKKQNHPTISRSDYVCCGCNTPHNGLCCPSCGSTNRIGNIFRIKESEATKVANGEDQKVLEIESTKQQLHIPVAGQVVLGSGSGANVHSIMSALERAEASTHEVVKAVENLANRIEPMMKPAAPCEEEKQPSTSDCFSTIGNQINSIECSNRKTVCLIDILLSRLEI